MENTNNLPIKHFSYSMMTLWEQCRECWKYKYVMHLEGETPAYFEDGREYHDNVDNYHTGRPYNAELIKPYTTVFPVEFRKQSEVWVEDLNGGKPVYLVGEEMFRAKVLPLPFKGKIDGINDECITDLKYMKGRINQKQADSNDQATFYIWAYYVLTGKLMPFWYTMVDKVTNRVGLVKTTRTLKDFDTAFERAMRFIDEVSQADFDATPGQRCYGQCEYYSICTNCGGKHGH